MRLMNGIIRKPFPSTSLFAGLSYFDHSDTPDPLDNPVVNDILKPAHSYQTDSRFYRLDGTQTTHQTRGIYIHNGKKVVILGKGPAN